MPPEFEDMWVAVIEQGESGKVAIGGANKATDSMTNSAVFLVADWFSGEEMVLEQWHINNIFFNLRGKEFRVLNRETVPSRRVSRHAGIDITGTQHLGSQQRLPLGVSKHSGKPLGTKGMRTCDDSSNLAAPTDEM